MEVRNSEVDKNQRITKDKWVLTLARKMQGSHPQHAFLILESIEEGRAVIRFMDFIGPRINKGGIFVPNLKIGTIRCGEKDGCTFFAESEEELQKDALVFRCRREMMDLQPGDKICAKVWYIDGEHANELIKAIMKDKEKLPIFNIFGKGSKPTKTSAYSSRKEEGHNCFTYAREKIANLSTPNIFVEPLVKGSWPYYMEQVAALTSLTLKKTVITLSGQSQTEKKSISYCSRFFASKTTILGISVAVAGVVATCCYRSQAQP